MVKRKFRRPNQLNIVLGKKQSFGPDLGPPVTKLKTRRFRR